MRVLGIVGSPRGGGNTETLVDEVLAGAQEAGAKTERITLSALRVEPCRACDACRGMGKCVIDDDMRELITRMESSEVWVLGTPVYWWGPTAQFKAFLDRWYAFDGKREFFHRRVVFVVPSGGGETYADHTAGMLEEIAGYLGMDHRDTILAGGSGRPGSVRNRDELMARARAAGHHAAS